MTLPKIDIPTFKLTIPSTKKEITMRCMKVSDEKILLMAREGNDYKEIMTAIKQVINNCINFNDPRESISVDSLAIFDLEYIFLQLRGHSISEVIQLSFIDNEEVDTAINDLKDLVDDQEKLIDKARAEATRTFDVNLYEVKVKFPEKAIDNRIKVSDNVYIVMKWPPASLYSEEDFTTVEGADKIMDVLAVASVDKVEDGKGKVYEYSTVELVQMLDGLSIKAYGKIMEYLSNLPHLEYEIKYTNKLGKDRSIVLTRLQDFFTL